MTAALVVGIGNPGRQYARTRHNVGQECVDELARRAGVTLRAGRDHAMTADVRIGDHHVVLAFPTTYMNDSGRAVSALMRRNGLSRPDQVIVVHDELDLPPAIVRVKVGGGLAGHNGLRSITDHLHSQDFARIRIGVGKPPSKERGAAHVLSKMSSADRALMDVAIQEAADAVEMFLVEGPQATMQRFNTSRPEPESDPPAQPEP